MEKSFAFNSINGDRKYKAEEFRRYFASFIGNGVFPNPATNLEVISNNDMTIKVFKGTAFIEGAFYENTDDLILKIEPADGVLNRIDRIVVRMDTLERNITCKIKKGTFASNPVAPDLQRDADAYELCLAEIKVDAGAISILQSKITDTRLNSEVCGIVTQTIKDIDTSVLYKQLEADIIEKGIDMQAFIEEYKRYLKDFFKNDDSVAISIFNKISELENKINSNSNLENKLNEISSQISELSKLSNGGNASPDDVLEGKTFTNDAGKQIGTLVDRGEGQTITPSAKGTTLEKGVYRSNIVVKGDENLKSSNIKKGITLFGVKGECEENIFENVKDWNDIQTYEAIDDVKKGDIVLLENIIEKLDFNYTNNYEIFNYSSSVFNALSAFKGCFSNNLKYLVLTGNKGLLFFKESNGKFVKLPNPNIPGPSLNTSSYSNLNDFKFSNDDTLLSVITQYKHYLYEIKNDTISSVKSEPTSTSTQGLSVLQYPGRMSDDGTKFAYAYRYSNIYKLIAIYHRNPLTKEYKQIHQSSREDGTSSESYLSPFNINDDILFQTYNTTKKWGIVKKNNEQNFKNYECGMNLDDLDSGYVGDLFSSGLKWMDEKTLYYYNGSSFTIYEFDYCNLSIINKFEFYNKIPVENKEFILNIVPIYKNFIFITCYNDSVKKTKIKLYKVDGQSCVFVKTITEIDGISYILDVCNKYILIYIKNKGVYCCNIQEVKTTKKIIRKFEKNLIESQKGIVLEAAKKGETVKVNKIQKI